MKNKLSRDESREAYNALSNKEKIQHDGKRLLKVLDIVRKILRVFAIIAFAVGCIFVSASVTHKSMILQQEIGFVELKEDMPGINLVSILDEANIRLEENTPAGWDKFFLEIGVYSITWSVVIIILMVITHFIKNIFNQIVNDESPFSEKSKMPLRKVFILMTIMLFFHDKIIGVVCGFVFLYLYRLFAYGCELQTESDETL